MPTIVLKLFAGQGIRRMDGQSSDYNYASAVGELNKSNMNVIVL